MSEKPRPTKRPSKKAPTKAPAVARKPAPAKPKSGFYVIESEGAISISDKLPKGSKTSPQFNTFTDARSVAIDALLETIERAEEQIVLLKQMPPR